MELEKSVVQSACEIVKKAGQFMLTFYGKKLEIYEKKDAGFVTNADLEVEKYLIQALAKLFPEASFFAEEEGSLGNSDWCWVIDPLDGTTNFARNIPYFCISVALAYKNEPQLGIVYDPLRDELFVAQKGQATTLNEKMITVGNKRMLNEAMIFFGLPYKKDKAHSDTLQVADKMGPHVFSYRHLGAIGLDQAYVACGRSDGLFFQELGWYDIAAGMLLIQEAGGVVTTYQGALPSVNYHSYVAANPDLHLQLIEFLK
jgi:myo-inositol-1(or 4)-monophosphatase